MKAIVPEMKHPWFVSTGIRVRSPTSDSKAQTSTSRAKPEVKPTAEASSPSAVKSPRPGKLKNNLCNSFVFVHTGFLNGLEKP